MRVELRYICLIVLFILVCSTQSFAQVATGTPPFGSFSGSATDVVNNADLNIHFAVPVMSKPGRGIPFSYMLSYDSSVWYPVGVSGSQTWQSVPNWGWRGKTEMATGYITYSTGQTRCHDLDTGGWIYQNYYNKWVYHDPFGVSHNFGGFLVSDGACGGATSGTKTAIDGSGYTITADGESVTATIKSRSGEEYDAPLQSSSGAGIFTDTNGNRINVSSSGVFTDTLGSTVLSITGSGTPASPLSFTYSSPSGSSISVILHYTNKTVRTYFGCSGIAEYGPTTIALVTDITLPNSKTYTVQYEATPGTSTGEVTGRIQSITLPTGGTISYSYSGGSNGIICGDGSTSGLTRTTPDGAWIFARTQVGSDWKTTITAPQLSYDSAANVTTLTFNSSGQLTSEKHYQGAETGTPLRAISTSWATNGTPSSSTITLEDGSTQTKTDTTFDDYGNLTQSIEYAWGATTAVRTTQITYLSTSGYTSRGIFDRPTQVLIRDGGTSGTIKSRTDITYDDSGYLNTSCPTGVAQHDDANYGCNFTVRGLPTSSTTYATASGPSGGVTSHFFYDFFGNLRKTDVNGTQQKSWSFSSATTYAYPDSATYGPSSPQLTTSATYNSYTGLLASTTDENSKQINFAYDTMSRVTSITKLDGTTTIAQQLIQYDDTNRIVTVSSPLEGSFASPTKTLVQKSYFDSLGRAYRQEIRDQSSSVYSIVDANFDVLGQAFRQSNPYSSSAQFWRETRTDAIGRITATHLVDSTASWAVQSGNSTTYSYSLKTSTVTDPAGNARKSEMDAQGRIIKVSEPDINNGNQLTQDTTQAYNILDLVTSVTQGSQTRSLTYDDMGRLTQQSTPEAGTWNFTYNNFNLVATRTDARGVITTYSYDSLNRPYTISYNVGSTGVPATNTVTYTYGTSPSSNNNGRLTNVTNTTVSDSLSYDNLGRVTQGDRVISSVTYTTQYSYNLASALTQMTYPSGRVVKQDFDAIGRLSKLYKDTNTTYADTFGYNAAAQLTGFNYGNGVSASFGISANRLQLTSLSYVKSSQNLFALSFYYYTDSTNCPNAPSGNNSQIRCIKDISDTTLTPGAGGRSVTYTYDPLYRLSTAATSGSTQYPAWGLSWTYDRYGNRTAQSIFSGCTGLTCPTNTLSVSATTNRITDTWAGYDANGNMTNDGSNTLSYDAENHMVGAAGSSYVIDGSGLRIRKCAPNCTSPTSNTVYIFGGTKVIAEYDNGAAVGSPTREYIYNGGRLLAKFESGATVYYHQDLLSNRLTTNSSGTILGQFGHFPFGESCYAGPTEKLRFTSYERDSESSNDYAIFRSYIYRFGRFSSADPISGFIEDPQSNNRFAYVRNDPVNSIDTLGLDPFMWAGTPTIAPPENFSNRPPNQSIIWGGWLRNYQAPPRTPDSTVQKGGRGNGALDNLPLGSRHWDPAVLSGQPPIPIWCRPDVIKAMNDIWNMTGNANQMNRDLPIEAGFNLNGSQNNYQIGASFTNEVGKMKIRYNTLYGTWPTFANFHVHPKRGDGNNGLPSTPQTSYSGGLGDTGAFDNVYAKDQNGQHQSITVFVMSWFGLAAYNPATKITTQLVNGTGFLTGQDCPK